MSMFTTIASGSYDPNTDTLSVRSTFTADEEAVIASAVRQQNGWKRRFGTADRDDMRDHVFDAVCAVYGDPDLVEGDVFDALVNEAMERWS